MQRCAPLAWLMAALLLAGCGASAQPIIPTDPPTITPTPTVTATRTPDLFATPTTVPTRAAVVGAGPSPTGLFGSTSTPPALLATPTRPLNPNAPRIEFFTSDVLAASPGSNITLFWSTRNVNTATIYRLDASGQRAQLWNVPPDGSLPVSTRRTDRIQIDFVLSVGEGANSIEQRLTIPLSCPDPWFFEPGPDACPTGPPVESEVIEQPFERGRMLYLGRTNRIFVLFNDGREPAWIAADNRFDPAVHAQLEASFIPPPGLYQPVAILGFVWRGRDIVRNRLGLALLPEVNYQGVYQISAALDGAETLYISSADGSALQLLPAGAAWRIIGP